MNFSAVFLISLVYCITFALKNNKPMQQSGRKESKRSLCLFAGRIEQADVSFDDGTSRSVLGPGSQEPGNPSREGKSQG